MHLAYRTPSRHRGRYGLGAGATAALTQAVSSFGQAAIKGARFRSTISPEVSLSSQVLFAGQRRPTTVEGGSPAETFLRFVRPAVYLDTALGTRVIAPWGEPNRNWFPLIAAGAVVLTAVGAGIFLRGLR